MLKHITLLTNSAGQVRTSFPPYYLCRYKVIRTKLVNQLFCLIIICYGGHGSLHRFYCGLSPNFRCLAVGVRQLLKLADTYTLESHVNAL